MHCARKLFSKVDSLIVTGSEIFVRDTAIINILVKHNIYGRFLLKTPEQKHYKKFLFVSSNKVKVMQKYQMFELISRIISTDLKKHL